MRSLSLALLTLVLIAACAPGPGLDPGPSRQPAPPASFGEVASDLLIAVNLERSRGATCAADYFRPAPPLTLEERLVRTAELHTSDMVRNGFFSHAGSDGSSVGDRASRQGYVWRAVGENIAWGQRSVEQVMTAWMNSPGHCRAIMNGEFQELGAAWEDDFWTLVFGTPR